MPKALTYQCPNCGGVLSYDSSIQLLKCDFCESTFHEGEIDRSIPMGASVEAKETEHVKTVDEFLEHAPWEAEGTNAENAITYNCPSCGAGVVADQSMMTANCPFCGNNMLVSGIANAENVPQYVVPFEVSRERASHELTEHFKGKWYLSRKFQAELEHMKGVYVPYHLYDYEVHGTGQYIGYRESENENGSKSKTGYKPATRTGHANFTKIAVDGSSKMPDAHMDAIMPFDFNKMMPFSANYVVGYLAEVADESVEECRPRAESRAEVTFRESMRKSVEDLKGVDGIEEAHEDFESNLLSASTCSLPVWLMHCSWENIDMLFAVNGQTGECVGDLPVSKVRRGATVGGLLVALLIVWAVVVFGLLAHTSDQLKYALYGLFGIIIVVFLADAHFNHQMKSAIESKTAHENYTPEGLVLAEAWDSGKFYMSKKKAGKKLDEHLAEARPLDDQHSQYDPSGQYAEQPQYGQYPNYDE